MNETHERKSRHKTHVCNHKQSNGKTAAAERLLPEEKTGLCTSSISAKALAPASPIALRPSRQRCNSLPAHAHAAASARAPTSPMRLPNRLSERSGAAVREACEAGELELELGGDTDVDDEARSKERAVAADRSMSAAASAAAPAQPMRAEHSDSAVSERSGETC